MIGSRSIKIPYGRATIDVILRGVEAQVLEAHSSAMRDADEDNLVAAALERPFDSPRLRDMLLRGKQIAIIVPDTTRACPTRRLLPHVLGELSAAGASADNVLLVIASGIHPRVPHQEIRMLVGPEIFDRVQTLWHDPADVVLLGQSSLGTPMEIFRPVAHADLRICLGVIDFHYFAGFSGGAKAIFPGCGSRAAITANHRRMLHPRAAAGRIETNPVRRDLEEVAAAAGPTFILNVVLDASGRITDVLAGDAVSAHRAGSKLVSDRGIRPLSWRGDLVIAGAGGYPRDSTLYQAQKAIANAAYAVRPGGMLLILAECSRGFGDPIFEEWLTDPSLRGRVCRRLEDEFVLGGHKAAALEALLTETRIKLVSILRRDLVHRAGLQPFASANRALVAALDELPASPHVIVLPDAASVLPVPRDLPDQ